MVLEKSGKLITNTDLPSKSELQHWRKRVLSNPTEFYNMCLELQAAPKLNSLYEWSNWLTPVGLPKRFDVMFFLTSLPELPSYAEEDGNELVQGWARVLRLRTVFPVEPEYFLAFPVEKLWFSPVLPGIFRTVPVEKLWLFPVPVFPGYWSGYSVQPENLRAVTPILSDSSLTGKMGAHP